MAADIDREAKILGIEAGGLLRKRNVYGRIYRNIRNVDKGEKKASRQIEWLFGLRRSEERFVFDRLEENGDRIFRRTQKVAFNGLRTKTSIYNEKKGKKSEHRKYLGGLFKTGYEYDLNGRIVKSTFSNPIRAVSREIEGKILHSKKTNFGRFYSSREAALILPNGDTIERRTVERRVGSYLMKVKLDDDGNVESKTRSFGGLFKHKVDYDPVAGRKTIHYEMFFGFRTRDKAVRMTDDEIEKFAERKGRKEDFDKEWEPYSAEDSDVLRIGAEVNARSTRLGMAASKYSRANISDGHSEFDTPDLQIEEPFDGSLEEQWRQQKPYVANDMFGSSAEFHQPLPVKLPSPGATAHRKITPTLANPENVSSALKQSVTVAAANANSLNFNVGGYPAAAKFSSVEERRYVSNDSFGNQAEKLVKESVQPKVPTKTTSTSNLSREARDNLHKEVRADVSELLRLGRQNASSSGSTRGKDGQYLEGKKPMNMRSILEAEKDNSVQLEKTNSAQPEKTNSVSPVGWVPYLKSLVSTQNREFDREVEGRGR